MMEHFKHQELKTNLILRFAKVYKVTPTEILINPIMCQVIGDCIKGKMIYVDTISNQMLGLEPCQMKINLDGGVNE